VEHGEVKVLHPSAPAKAGAPPLVKGRTLAPFSPFTRGSERG